MKLNQNKSKTKFMRYTLFLILIILAGSCYSQNSIQPRVFSPEELNEDVDFLFNKFEQIHPDLYSYTAKSEIDLMRKKVKGELSQPVSRLEFALKIIPIVTSLKDAHTSLTLPQDERKELNTCKKEVKFSLLKS